MHFSITRMTKSTRLSLACRWDEAESEALKFKQEKALFGRAVGRLRALGAVSAVLRRTRVAREACPAARADSLAHLRVETRRHGIGLYPRVRDRGVFCVVAPHRAPEAVSFRALRALSAVARYPARDSDSQDARLRALWETRPRSVHFARAAPHSSPAARLTA